MSGPTSGGGTGPGPKPGASMRGNPMDPAVGAEGGAMLQAPWRMEYLDGMSAAEQAGKGSGAGGGSGAASGAGGPKGATTPGSPSGGSFLAEYWASPAGDERHNVIVRTGEGMVLLNAYPYSNGHLLVALGEGRPRLLDYTPVQRAALWRLVDAAAGLMDAALNCQGVNIGVNQGRAAGAGVPGHLHVHLVPRWGGDVNFMTTVGRVRVIPGSLEAMAARYRAAWKAIGPEWAALLRGEG